MSLFHSAFLHYKWSVFVRVCSYLFFHLYSVNDLSLPVSVLFCFFLHTAYLYMVYMCLFLFVCLSDILCGYKWHMLLSGDGLIYSFMCTVCLSIVNMCLYVCVLFCKFVSFSVCLSNIFLLCKCLHLCQWFFFSLINYPCMFCICQLVPVYQ